MSAASPTRQELTVDAVVIGGGLAGLVTAWGVARSGHSVCIVEKGDGSAEKIGESLGPSVRPLLRQLGVWEQFVADGHLPCYGNRSVWGQGTPADRDFIYDPHGHGWLIDRRRFESMLAEHTQAAGVRRLIQTRLTRWQRQSRGGWRLTLSGPQASPSLTTQFVVDATGRASWFARQQGVRRLHQDRLVSVVAFLQTDQQTEQHLTTMVEATPSGWWYSAPLPSCKLATAYMTDADLISFKSVRTASEWQRLLTATPYTAERVTGHGYRLTRPPSLVAAGSSRLAMLAGEGWLAVGDAAVAFDPLSSHGMAMAIAGGMRAADTIAKWLAGDREALGFYAKALQEYYEAYLPVRSGYYALERRWPQVPFWRRRLRPDTAAGQEDAALPKEQDNRHG